MNIAAVFWTYTVAEVPYSHCLFPRCETKAPPSPFSTLAFSQTEITSCTASSGRAGPVKCGAYCLCCMRSCSRLLSCSGVAGQKKVRPHNAVYKKRSRTVCELAIPNHPRTDADEKHAILSVLCTELGNRDVQSRFAHGISREHDYVELPGRVQICGAARYRHNLLRSAFKDEWQKQIKEMNVGYHVNPEEFNHLFFKLLRLVSSACSVGVSIGL